MAEPISVLTTSGKILTVKPGDDIDALVKNGTINKEQATAIGKMLKSESQDLNQGITVEAGTQGTQADRAARAAAHQQQTEEVAKMKAASQSQADKMQEELEAKDPGKYATDTSILREGTNKLKTKEDAEAAGFKHARKVARAARRINGRIDSFEAVEKIYTNKEEYKAAVKKAKADGTWDKDNPKYTLLDGDELEGAKKMQQESAKKVDEALKNYNKFKEIYENPKSDADKMAAFKEMVNAGKQLSENYYASKMFNEDGSINKDGYQKAMLQYAGADLKGNLDERKALKESADVSKREAKKMLEAAGLDVEKDYTWAMRAGTLAVGVGTGALAGLLGGGLAATAVATAVSKSTATATASATATATNHWTASNGEEFFDSVEATDTQTTTVTNTATDVARAADSISSGQMALRGAIGALPAAILSAALVKDRGGADAFNGLTAEQVLKNAGQVKGKTNKEIVQKIIDLPNLTTTQKAAILHAAYGNDTAKKVNTEELVAAYTAADYLDKHPELVAPEKGSTPPTTTPPTTTPPTTTPPTTTPADEDCYNVNEEKIRSEIPIIKFGGPWHYSKLYVNPDGTELSEADRRAVQKEISSGENAIQNTRNENGKITGRSLANEITLPNGKSVKLADDAVERAKRLKGQGGGRDRKYNTAGDGTLMWATDCKTGKRISPKMTPSEFAEWERKRAEK